jgi:hypothetical protein
MNTDYLTNRFSKEARNPFLILGAIISRFFCSKILGHKVDLGYTDSGYMVCKRCKMHEYYDSNFNSPALFLISKRIKWWIFEKYKDYKQSQSNELPF